MAQKTINTRILLRNDSAYAWTKANPILAKGEIGIETDTLKFKVGDNSTAWNALAYANKSITEIDQAIANSEDNATVVIPEGSETDSEAIAKACKDASKGDIAIVKRLIANSTDKYTHSAYVYDGKNWQAADGSYNAENVYLDKDLTITAEIGVQKPTDKGFKTLDTKGKNLKEILDLIVAEEKDPTVTNPSTSIKFKEEGSYEVGTKITPSYKVTLNPGKYEFGPATGVTANSYAVTCTGQTGTKSLDEGTFTEVQLKDNDVISMKVVTSYSDGVIPKTNLNNDCTGKQIKAGSVEATSSTATCYRNSYTGTLIDKAAELNSAAIRNLTATGKKMPDTLDVPVPVGAKRVVIAIPSDEHKDIDVLDKNGLNATIRSSFTVKDVNVEGANGYTAKAYKVYYIDFAEPNDKANTYIVNVTRNTASN